MTYPVTWFTPPQKPVEGGTVNVLPDTAPRHSAAPTDPSEGQEPASELARLTAALHANTCHPDWIYLYTFVAVSVPPASLHGSGWVENLEDPRHGGGIAPTLTWSWRRPKTTEELA